jgi:hypothetical protein
MYSKGRRKAYLYAVKEEHSRFWVHREEQQRIQSSDWSRLLCIKASDSPNQIDRQWSQLRVVHFQPLAHNTIVTISTYEEAAFDRSAIVEFRQNFSSP